MELHPASTSSQNLSIDRDDFDARPRPVGPRRLGQGQPDLRRRARRAARRTEQGAGRRMTDVVGKLWGFCHTLRHDGVDYGDYIEQITYLLFLKMADERGIELPEQTDWPYLRKQSGTDLLDALRRRPAHARQAAGHARRHLRRRAEPLHQPSQPRASSSVSSTRPSGPASTSTSRPPPSRACWRRPPPRARRAPASTSPRGR